MSRNERIVRELCDKSKQNNICIIGVPEEEKREKRIERVFKEIIAEKSPQSGKVNCLSGHGNAQISQHQGTLERQHQDI